LTASRYAQRAARRPTLVELLSGRSPTGEDGSAAHPTDHERPVEDRLIHVIRKLVRLRLDADRKLDFGPGL
jgi:hypothetical protein